MIEDLLEILDESINAHLEFVAKRPWMDLPNPIILSVGQVQRLVNEIRRLQAELDRAEGQQDWPLSWRDEE